MQSLEELVAKASAQFEALVWCRGWSLASATDSLCDLAQIYR